jgi:hypothetical protein
VSKVPAVQQTVLEAAGAVVTSTSLSLHDPDLPWEEYERLGQFIGDMNRACAWWVGDLVVFGEEIYGEAHAQIEQALGLAPQTIANRASVARHIPPGRRKQSLSFGTHAEVAYLPAKERDHWLSLADKGGWTRAKLREEMRNARAIDIGDGVLVDDRVGRSVVNSTHDAALGSSTVRTIECPHCGEEVTIP